ncbi:MAG: NfeD family protein [bacterium]
MVENVEPGSFNYDFSNVIRAFFVVIISVTLSIFLSIIITKQLFNLNFAIGSRLALAKTQQVDEGYTSASSAYSQMLHKTGVSKTILRPSGKVDIEGDMYDATALTGYIDSGEEIEVVNYRTGQLIVKRKSKS